MNTFLLLAEWFQFSVGEGAFYAVFGFTFVFFGILLLILILSGVGKIMSKINAKKMKDVAPIQPPKIERVEEEGVSPEVVAAITAALMAYYQEEESKCDFVVRRIKKV